MGRWIALGLSALMVVVGVIWTLQGLGHLEGSPMTGVQFWAVVGPALAGFAAACLVRFYAGTVAEAPLQCLFLLGLAGVAIATVAGEQFSWHPWTLSAATMAVMIVVAIADFEEAPGESGA